MQKARQKEEVAFLKHVVKEDLPISVFNSV